MTSVIETIRKARETRETHTELEQELFTQLEALFTMLIAQKFAADMEFPDLEAAAKDMLTHQVEKYRTTATEEETECYCNRVLAISALTKSTTGKLIA